MAKQVTLFVPLAGKDAGKGDGIGKTYLNNSRSQLLCVQLNLPPYRAVPRVFSFRL